MAQINPTVGDLAGNARLILGAHERGGKLGADLVIVPELALPGYPPLDLLDRPEFIQATEKARARLVQGVRGPALLMGTVVPNRSKTGKSLFNAAILIENGREIGRSYKTLLPTYDVFDEDRYFEPSGRRSPLDWNGVPLGISVCEDLWNDVLQGGQRRYPSDPLEDLAQAQAGLLINISASPFSLGRNRLREDLAVDKAKRLGLPILLVNQVGGNDELIFDGGSIAVDAQGVLVGRARSFEEDLLLVSFDEESGRLTLESDGSAPSGEESNDESAIFRALCLGLRDYAKKTGFEKAVLGLSGGIDSSLTAAVAAQALGPEEILGVAMPSPFSSPESFEDARQLAESLEIEMKSVSIEDTYRTIVASLGPEFDAERPTIVEENLQARIRASMLMAFANRDRRLLLTTGNKSELAVGYCTLYGDMAGGLAVLADVPKTMVYRVCRWLNRDGVVVPNRVLEKEPSAELRPNQRDQDSLPPYEILDRILTAYVEESKTIDEMVSEGLESSMVIRVVQMIHASEYKRRQSAPGLRVTTKAFGIGRRMPIAQTFREWEELS